MKYHQYANLFPMMNEQERQGLLEDMRKNGYRSECPIITYKGELLDGRNRYETAGILGIEPTYNEYDGNDPLGYVIGMNFNRRHLNETQRGVVASKLANMTRADAGNLGNISQGNATANLPLRYDDVYERKVTQSEAATMLNVSPRTIRTVKEVEKASPELMELMEKGEITASKAHKQVKLQQAHHEFTKQTKNSVTIAPIVEIADCVAWLSKIDKCDLLLTDPPYSTDVKDIMSFASWIKYGLEKVKDTGRAYVFIGAYPDEAMSYLLQATPSHIKLEQMLVWTYKNTLGNNPKDRYKLNYQFCLYYKGINAPELNCPLTSEQWAVMEINAPDGRLGDRYHAWQKPMELAEMLVRHSTNEGDTVYDPFTCTGTFLLAASKLGRKAFGCDVSKDNLSIAVERGCQYA